MELIQCCGCGSKFVRQEGDELPYYCKECSKQLYDEAKDFDDYYDDDFGEDDYDSCDDDWYTDEDECDIIDDYYL